MQVRSIWLALVALVALALAGAPAPAGAPPNVLLVTIDTLRADRLGSYGYRLAQTPVLDRLAREGVRFADASVHVPLTFPSHAAILTGRYPSSFGLHVNGMAPLPASVSTLATRFKSAGYGTAAFVASAILDQGYGLNRGFDRYDQNFGGKPKANVALTELQRPAGDVIRAVEEWLNAPPRQPWFAWVHLFDPHYPYEPPPKYLKLAGGRPYDGEIAYTDACLGSLFARLDPATTVVLVTSDHGESLGEHGELDHGFFLYDATLKVPMIVKAPGFSPRVVTEQVRSIDIRPTLEALAGLAAETDLDGESLVSLMRGGTRRNVPASYAETWYPRFHFAWSELRSIRVGEWKYIAAPRTELYDLRADARESTNAIAEKGAVAARLAEELGAIVRRSAVGSAADRTPAQPDPDAVRRLQALGYVGTFAPATAAAAGIDPKDKIAEYRTYRQQLTRALNALDAGQSSLAVSILKRMLAANVRAFEVHQYLGNAYAMQKRFDAALGEYEVAHQLNPELAQVHFEAAKALSMKGDPAAAAARAEEGLKLQPSSVYGLFTLGVIYQRAGRLPEAADALRRAVEADPTDPRARANLADVAMRLGQADVAKQQLEAMLAAGYEVPVARYNLGVIAERSGDRAGAERNYRAALAADAAFKPAADALARLTRRVP